MIPAFLSHFEGSWEFLETLRNILERFKVFFADSGSSGRLSCVSRRLKKNFRQIRSLLKPFQAVSVSLLAIFGVSNILGCF